MRSAEIIFVPTDASSPQLTTLLARQRSYTCSAEIISVPTDASSNDFVFNNNKNSIIFAGYTFGYSLDPYVVLSLVGGGSPGQGLWV
jgi:hypothetical protein